jgi:hypothetical protein
MKVRYFVVAMMCLWTAGQGARCQGAEVLQLGEAKETVIRKLGSPTYSDVHGNRENCYFQNASVHFADGKVVEFNMLPDPHGLPSARGDETPNVERTKAVTASLRKQTEQGEKSRETAEWGVARPFWLSGNAIQATPEGVLIRGSMLSEQEYQEKAQVQRDLSAVDKSLFNESLGTNEIMNLYREKRALMAKMPKSRYGLFLVAGSTNSLPEGKPWEGTGYSAGTERIEQNSKGVRTVRRFAVTSEMAEALLKSPSPSRNSRE